MKGIVTDPTKLNAFIEAAAPWIIGTGGKVTPAGFQAFARRGGAAWANADLSKSLPGIAVGIADLGGPTAGQSTMSLYQLMTGTMTLSKQQLNTMRELGLIDPSKVTMTGFGGSRAQLAPGAISGSLEHTGDLPGWIRDVVMPAVNKAAGGDKALEQSLLAKMFPNRNALRMALMLGEPGFREQIAKDVGIVGGVMPINQAYQNFITKNPAGVEKAFNAQFQSMMSAIGAPVMQAAIPVMRSVTELFTKIGEFANKNPGVFEAMAKGFAALSVALAGFGAGMIAGGPLGGVIGALTALGGLELWRKGKDIDLVIGYLNSLAYALSATLETGLKAAADAVNAFADKLFAIGKKIWDFVSTLGGLLQKTSFGGGGGGGGGIINASYGGAGGSAALARAAQESGGTADYIRQSAAAHGVDPNVAVAVARSEGLHGYVGDHGTSFGPFQLHYARDGGAEGNLFTRATGLDARNPSTVKAQIDWAMSRAAQRGWGAWHGAANTGIGRWQGIHPNHGRVSDVAPYSHQGKQLQVHTEINVDGRKLAQAVTGHYLRDNAHSKQAAYFNGLRHYAGPDRQVNTA